MRLGRFGIEMTIMKKAMFYKEHPFFETQPFQ